MVTSASHSDEERTQVLPAARVRSPLGPQPGPQPIMAPVQQPVTGRASERAAMPVDLPPDATAVIERPDPVPHPQAPSPAESLTVPWHRIATGRNVEDPLANGPVRHRWRKVAGRTLSKAWADSLFGMSSQAAFWSALSTAPLLLALLGSVGYVARWFGPDTIGKVKEQVDTFLHGIFNQEVATDLVGNTVDTILRNGQADVVSVGFLISLWAGSSAMSAFVEAITIAYCQHEVRHPVAERFFALGLYLAALFSGVLLLPVLAIGPESLPKLFPRSWQDEVSTIVGIAYFPGLIIGLVVLLTTLYKLAPKHRHAWKRGLPGALLAAIVFLVASFGLRVYLAYVYSHGLTYGALAVPITFLLFYYFIAMAIIIGAQFNNALLEYYPPRRSRREMRRWRRYDPQRDPAPATD